MRSFLTLACLALFAGGGQQPRITDLLVSRHNGQLLVSFQFLDAFNRPTLERIESGLPTAFTYQIKLEKIHRWWFDNTLEHSTLQVVAMYNAITREYLVNFKHDGRLIDSRVVQSTDELERSMTLVHALPTFVVEELPGRLVVRVRVELGSKTILGIIPTTIHTEWAESPRFRTTDDPLPPESVEASEQP